MIEITPPRVFFGALTLISVIIWLVGGCGFLAKAMHAQAMEYNEVYTGENEEENEDEGKGDNKLPTLKKRK